MKQKIIQQGAEAIIILKDDLVLKRRVKKGYRIREMDDVIRKRRTRREARILAKAANFIDVPKVVKVDDRTMEIDMAFIDGKKLSEHLDDLKNWKDVCTVIGKNIAKLHDTDIIHGDLTTSNMIFAESTQKAPTHPPAMLSGTSRSASRGVTDEGREGVRVYFIDFGLSFGNGRIEDKAVDLHLIKQALEAKHFAKFDEYFTAVLEGYSISKNYKKVLDQFRKVEKRGRYKTQY